MQRHHNGLKTAALFGAIWAILLGIGALVGAVVVVAADHVAAYAIPGTALPVGVVTGLLGAPVLLWMLRSRSTSPEGR